MGTDAILEHILEQLFTLCREQYGNYVVQHVLEHGRDKDKKRVVALVQQHATDLACHKYGSNVVEKALLLADATERRQIAESLFGSPIDSQRLEHLVLDRFANLSYSVCWKSPTPLCAQRCHDYSTECV